MAPSVANGLFSHEAPLIGERLARYRDSPDFYAEPWQLRRSLDDSAVAVLQTWFLEQGGRGAQPSGGSRSRNVLVTAAAISVLGELYGDRFQTLVLAGQPERLGMAAGVAGLPGAHPGGFRSQQWGGVV